MTGLLAGGLALADRAHEVMQQIVALRQGIEARFLLMGQLLAEVRDDRLYVALGCESFEAFLGEPEIGLSRSHAYRLIGIAATFTAGVPPVGREEHFEQLAVIGVKKLSQIASVVREHPEQAGEWLDRAEALSASALDGEIKAARGVERTQADEWYDRRFRAIEALCEQARARTVGRGAAADAIIVEGMRIQERVQLGGRHGDDAGAVRWEDKGDGG